jgi:hypothetical protein
MAVAVDVATADKTTLPAVCDGQMTGSIVRHHKKNPPPDCTVEQSP